MEEKKINIAFMGTPEFAVPSLSILLRENINVSVVVTAPDKASGRGLKTGSSAIKKFADLHKIPVLQPADLRDEDFLNSLRSFGVNLIVVVAFRKLPKAVFELPKYGTFNLHASLLPQYRGAAPIQRAVMNGEKITGATTFFIEEKIDTGKIILQAELGIGDDETAGDIHDKLMELGADLVLKTVLLIRDNKVKERAQNSQNVDGQKLNTAPKIFRADCKIDWAKSANQIHDHVRGLSPYPAAYTTLCNPENTCIEVKILRTALIENGEHVEQIQIETDQKSYLNVICNGGIITVLKIQSAGKKAMEIAEWLKGSGINKHWYFKS